MVCGRSANLTVEIRALRDTLRAVEGDLDEQSAIVAVLQQQQMATQAALEVLQAAVLTLTGDAAGIRNEWQKENADTALLFQRVADLVPPNPPAPEEVLPCQGDACSPSVEARGGNIILAAPGGSVRLVSAECRASVNLCEVAQLARYLQMAVNKLGDGNA